jgi:hypothetical protein
MTDLAVEPRASRRRWRRRLLLAPLFALVAVLMTVIVWLLLAYHDVANDLNSSRERLPGSVSATLVPRGSVLDEPQITIALARGRDPAAAPILFRSDPDRRVMGLLLLPIVHGHASESEVIRNVSRLIGADINHVLVVSPAGLGSIVHAIGPITIRNPRPVDYLLEGGRYWHFPAGSVTLDGAHALAFMSGRGETTTAARAQLVLGGIVRALLAPSTISELRDAVHSISTSAETDLTAGDLLGLAWLRFRSKTLLRCGGTKPGEAKTNLTAAGLRVFLGRNASGDDVAATGCSSTRLRPSSIPLPPKAVVTAIRSVYPHLWQVALGVFAAGVVLATMLLVGPSRLWMELKRLRSRRRVAVPTRRESIRARARAVSSSAAAVGWSLRRNRGDIYLYTLVIVISVAAGFTVVRLL